MDLKKLAGQAGQLFTRAVQYTEEKLGNAEKTEFDGHYESLVQQYESTKNWTEKLMNGAQAVIIPNPGNRVEDMLFEKIEKRRPSRLSNLEFLGLDMVQAANEFGAGTSYGSALSKVGGAEQRLGFVEREFINSAIEGFVHPLHKFLDTEIKNIAKERRVLDTKRLDLDACKSRLRKARSMDTQTTKDNVDPKVLVSQAEADLRRTQAEFDRQTEITKLLLEGVRSSQASHLRHLNELVEAQLEYYKKSHEVMVELQKELASHSTEDASSSSLLGDTEETTQPTKDSINNNKSNEIDWRKAKVVCDYDTTATDELSVRMNEIVSFKDTGSSAADFVSVRRGTEAGKVPRVYLEALDD